MVIPVVAGRVAFMLIPLALMAGLPSNPTAMLALLFICLGVFALSDGAATVTWSDIMARAMSMRQRGRFMGVSEVMGGLAGIGAGILVGKIVGSPKLPFPYDYVLLFVLASVLFGVSTIAVALIREPPRQETDANGEIRGQKAAAQAGGSWYRLLVSDHTFRRLLVCRVLVSMIGLASPFYAVHAADALGLPESIVGSFVIAQALATVVASFGLGLLSERHGPLPVIRIGSALGVVGPLLALAFHFAGGQDWVVWVYPLVFVALGATRSSWMMGFTNYMLEIAPEALRPVYIGTGNTARGLLMVLPVLGGWLLEVTSYPVLFGVTIAVGLFGFRMSLRLGTSPGVEPQ